MENVKQNTMKYKILFIFSFLLLTLLLFNTNVFAAYDLTVDGTIYKMPDWFTSKQYRIFYYNGSYVFIACSDSPLIMKKFSGTSQVGFETSDGSQFYGTGTTSDSSSSDFSSLTGKYYNSTQGWTSFNTSSGIKYANYDVYYGENLVFQSPVQEMTLAQVLAETQKINPKLTLAEIAKIVTLIIAVVVSLVGFRKAWTLLRTSLNRS